MSIEKQIMTAVARTDLIWCAAARVMVVLVLIGIVAIGVLAVRGMVNVGRHMIDYGAAVDSQNRPSAVRPLDEPTLLEQSCLDRPGVDITSEGPDGDFTENYYREVD